MPDVPNISDEDGEHSLPDYELAPMVRADTPTQLKALSHPIRNAILHLVLERAATTGELAEAIGRPHGTIAHHLKVLEAAGLVRVVRTRQVRAVTERYWGRTGRTIMIDKPPGDRPGTGAVSFLQEAATTMVDGEHGYDTLRYARVDPARVDELAARLDALALEFVALPRSGDTVYALLLAIHPTDQPVLPEHGPGPDPDPDPDPDGRGARRKARGDDD